MAQLVVLRQLLHKNPRITSTLKVKWSRMIATTQGPLYQTRKEDPNANRTLQETTGPTDISTDVRPLAEKIKENTKTASYTAIILAGVGVTGIVFYAIFRELFSSSSPNNIYSDAFDLVKEDPRVQDALGAPIKGYGEESRRGRRQRVAHSTFERNGVLHVRMQFYVQGIRNRGTVHLESRKTPSGKMEYRYLFVQLDYYPHTTIIIEDNRAYDPSPASAKSLIDSESLDFTSFQKK
ncbi:PREDICTED: mitochondrial import inner membrane translocase subunit Tim21 [Rhagoletis zephyria]|uniref:mitochondrial import inner membrane translocase subunit Tim21 n=1 Tax=Rhagoletis zephyria TaxID=28612 RepID=UPI0008116D26|nr:PREDICTED: mitochondrial import inner membrane translocase subunit Tim21 [Rhagoletis zephyria]